MFMSFDNRSLNNYMQEKMRKFTKLDNNPKLYAYLSEYCTIEHDKTEFYIYI